VLSHRPAAGSPAAIPIGSYAEFQLINTDAATLGGSYKQEADLDLMGEEWTPVGNYGISTAYYFSGQFDGGGHAIANLKITGSNDYVGLFGSVDGGNISKVCINSGSVSGGNQVGGVAGINSGTVIACYWEDVGGDNAVNGIGSSASNTNATPFNPGLWPTNSSTGWGIGNNPVIGKYWKNLNGSPTGHPQLWWE
jgi:hypothetical protein